MDFEVNGRRVYQGWDPAAAGEPAMAADLQVADVIPDTTGHVVIRLRATGAHDAILQGIALE